MQGIKSNLAFFPLNVSRVAGMNSGITAWSRSLTLLSFSQDFLLLNEHILHPSHSLASDL